jgi:DNA repair exonuclease SbcCD ATPase subunit
VEKAWQKPSELYDPVEEENALLKAAKDTLAALDQLEEQIVKWPRTRDGKLKQVFDRLIHGRTNDITPDGVLAAYVKQANDQLEAQQADIGKLIEAGDAMAKEVDRFIAPNEYTSKMQSAWEAAKSAAPAQQQPSITVETLKEHEPKSGIYITLQPHGYEVDLVNHKMILDLYMKHPNDFFTASECRDYGHDIDTQQVTQRIIDLVRKADQQQPDISK